MTPNRTTQEIGTSENNNGINNIIIFYFINLVFI